MSMSKKDFIALANELHSVYVPIDVVDALVRFCKKQNSAFKEDSWRGYLEGTCGPSGGKIEALR